VTASTGIERSDAICKVFITLPLYDSGAISASLRSA
jgi:hypothetical protein